MLTIIKTLWRTIQCFFKCLTCITLLLSRKCKGSLSDGLQTFLSRFFSFQACLEVLPTWQLNQLCSFCSSFERAKRFTRFFFPMGWTELKDEAGMHHLQKCPFSFQNVAWQLYSSLLLLLYVITALLERQKYVWMRPGRGEEQMTEAAQSRAELRQTKVLWSVRSFGSILQLRAQRFSRLLNNSQQGLAKLQPGATVSPAAD